MTDRRANMRWYGTYGLAALLSVQAACVSHQHKPDKAALMQSADCEIVNGSYVVDSPDDGQVLAKSLFAEAGTVSAMTVWKAPNQVTMRASAEDGEPLPAAIFSRVFCLDSVLKVILSDQAHGGGLGTTASDRVLELFASGDDSLNLRFVTRTLGFLYIIPYYSSSDELVVLKRQTDASR